ncbi:MAG: hypothetical protein OEZ13_08480 [Spirochaetia bacterium]|nr:hypothetical protein [Spirochaetia bacterium]
MKKRKKKILLIFLFLLFNINRLYAAGGVSPAYLLEEASSAAHLSQGSGGFSSDISQIWYNPAALFPYIEGRNFSFSYMGSSINYDQNFVFIGYAWPSSKTSKYALSISYFSNSSLESYDGSGNFLELYGTHEFLIGFSHYWEIFSWLYMGENIKLFYFDYYYAASIAGAIDAGFLFRPIEYLDFGLNLDNIWSTDILLATEQESIPMTLRLSTAVNFWERRIRFFYDLLYPLPVYERRYENPEHKIGMSLDVYKGYIQLRGGYDFENLSFGIGSKLKQYDISLAYLPNAFEDRIALTLTFDIDTAGFGPFGRPENLPATNIEQELMEFHEGIENYSKGEHKKAYDNFVKVLELNPEHELALKYKERTLLHLRTSSGWLDEEHMKLLRLHKELARKYESQGNYGDAIAEWRAVLEIDPTDNETRPNIERIKQLVQTKVEAHHKNGLNFYSKDDKIKAIDSFTQALNYNPEYEPSKNWLIKIKQELSREELKEREIIERQHKAHVFFNRGLSYFGRKAFQESIAAFDETLKMDPDHSDAKKYKKLALEEWEAEKMGLRGLEAANSFYQKGMKNYTEEKYYNAVKDFERSLKAHATHKESERMLPQAQKKLELQIAPYLLEGKTAFRLKKFAEAREKFSKVKSLHPENEEALNFLEKIKNESAATVKFHFIEGKNAFTEAEKTNQTKMFSKSIFHFNEILKLSPEHKAAKEFLEKAQAKVKNQADGLHQEAMSLYNKKDYTPAIKKWEQVLDIDPANALARRYIDETENKLKEKKYGKLVEEWMTKGVQYFQNRDFDKALGFFNKVLDIDKNHKKAIEMKEMCSNEKKREKAQDEIAGLFIQGVKEYKKRKYESAIEKWKQVKKLDPDNVLVDKYISKAEDGIKTRKVIDFVNGKKYYDQGNWVLAKTNLEKAIKVDPSNSKARSLLQDTLDRIEEERLQFMQDGDKLMREGKYEEASQAYLNAYRLDNRSEVYNKREEALKAKKSLEEAMNYYEKNQFGLCLEPFTRVLEISPFDKKTRDIFEMAKQKGKNQITAWLDKARAAFDRKDYKTAYSFFVSVKQIDENNIHSIKGLAKTKTKLREIAVKPYKEGQEAMAIKNYTLAIGKFKEVLEIMDDYEDTKKLLSEARDELNKKRSSGAKKTAASEEDEKNINRGIFLYRQGKYKEAIKIWEKVPKTSEAFSKAQKYINRAKLKL